MSRPRSLRGSASFELQKAMQKILDTLYLHRSEDDRLLSRLFQELPDKKVYSDYYLVINTPMALDNIQAKLKKGGYTDFDEFVRDVAQIFYNAKFYNNRGSEVFEDACTLENLLQEELKLLQARGYVENASIPDLGPLPPSSPVSARSDSPEGSSDESDSDSNSDSEDEAEDDAGGAEDDEEEYAEKGTKADSVTRTVRPRTRRTTAGGSTSAEDKKETSARPSENTPKPGAEAAPRKRKRGRPPKIDTPEEARVRAILRAIRKVKDSDGRQLFLEFEKLPDQEQYPDYYKEIKRPIALDHITKKIKRRDYRKMEHFVADMNLMFNNAQRYNADESQIFQDAVTLQNTLAKVAEEEGKKGDAEYINRGLAKDPTAMETGVGESGAKIQRIPIGSVEANGERFEIGDWVTLTNPNDAEKPIIAQIFKTWQTANGEQWVNVCWYYRPEQTVHRSSRVFYENEVFKSGQYRDHPSSQILSKTFTQFITRYTRGRPKHWPANEKIWVCESRYNDLTKAFSKINQWRACVPEEIRFDEYELFLFDRQRQYERFPSPLMPLLKPDEKIVGEGDKLPEPIEPGSEEGPPTVGAIYRGDSPEPEKEPTPPPPPPQPVTHDSRNLESMASMTPGLPQPMPYKNPMTPGLHGYPPHSYRPMASQQQLRYPSVSGRQHQQTPQNPPHISEQPLAFTMPVAVPSEVAELVAKDNQGRVLWFGVPPVDVVGWSGGEGVRGHSLEYLAKKRKKEGNVELMQDVQRTETSEERGFKKRATEILVKALEKIGN